MTKLTPGPAFVVTADLLSSRPAMSPPLPGPISTKLYASASCPELRAESVISSDDESDGGRFLEPLLETCDEVGDREGAVSMDAAEGRDILLEPASSSVSSSLSASSDISSRRKLQWEFKGLTLWLELEEFDSDLTRAVEDFSSRHSSPFIPKPHTTAIYGMEHLSVAEAKRRLRKVKDWPRFSRPTGLTSDVAVCGRPGQVCSIAWSELTLASDPDHEAALDALHRLFYADESSEDENDDESSAAPERDRPWKPHNSVAYDNPETNALSLLDTVVYASENPTLLGRERRVEAMSLWSTEGKMEEWHCLDRVRFF